MPLDQWMASVGEQRFLFLVALATGAAFGFFAQRSRFCMRSAVIDCLAHLPPHPMTTPVGSGPGYRKLAIWLLAFSVAVCGVQTLAWLGKFDADAVRQLTTAGSLSGAIIGGLLLGAGMILTRGCPSRMLVLSANGNLRALLAGTFFVVTAQAAIGGVLVPVRDWLSALWPVAPEMRNLLSVLGWGHGGGVFVGVCWLAAGLYVARRSALTGIEWIGSFGVGLTVCATWWLTYQVSTQAFDIVVTVQAISFTNPSSEVLMWLLTPGAGSWSFGLGLVVGVVLGSLVASLWAKEFHLEGFGPQHHLPRYLIGAVAMGLGGVLAGGCAVGAGVSGASVFGLTAWVALFCMWISAAVAHRLIDQRAH